MVISKVVRHRRIRVLIAVISLSAVGAALIVSLLLNVLKKTEEAKSPFFHVVQIDDETESPEVWGQNFPHQYDGYKSTVDQVRTRYGGSEALPRTPTEADPRSIVAQSKIEEDDRLKIMWAGYAFSKDFREERGHAYMLLDQTYTERQKVIKQPGACIHCHASTYVPLRKIGEGDLQKGFELVNKMSYADARLHVAHPVSCIDCHEPQSMSLRITRPAFMEGIRLVKAQQGIEDFDVNNDASHQEMRTYVCAQCHVEYYFKGSEKRLTYPWANGLNADRILEYYDQQNFKDWEHALTGSPTLKAQHPEFEMWSQGIHAASGVSCADCHMPYKRLGAMKVTDHHIRSPLLNIGKACQTCHHFSETELIRRVDVIQTRHTEMRNLAMNALMDLIEMLKLERENNAPTQSLFAAQDFQRKAQFLLDFAEAENSTGFHAPQEAARLLGLSIDYSRKGAKELLRK